jgi:hypothetical protein
MLTCCGMQRNTEPISPKALTSTGMLEGFRGLLSLSFVVTIPIPPNLPSVTEEYHVHLRWHQPEMRDRNPYTSVRSRLAGSSQLQGE